MMTGATYGYYTSSNNGATWSLNKEGEAGRSLKGFVKLNDNSVLAYGFGAIRIAENNSEWTLQSDQYFYNEIVTSNGMNLFSFENSNSSDEIILLSSIDQGVTWTNHAIIGLPGTPIKMEVDAENNLYFLINDQIWKLSAGEKSVTRLTSLTAPYIQDFKVVRNSIFVLNEGVLYTSSDNGKTFVSKDATAPATALWVHDDKNVFLGTANNNLYLSNDIGTSWTNKPLPDTKDLITHVHVSKEGFLFVVTSNSVFSSKNKWVGSN
jgi:photosystem II stability/assembly factor-like uncharacterized protein